MRRFILVISVLALLMTLGIVASAQQDDIVHTVAPGENLFRISLRYNMPMATIAARNGISNYNLIYAGTQLIIPLSGSTGDAGDGDNGGDSGDGGQMGTYTVVVGDTLNKIARAYNTTVSAIAAANSIVNINLIYPGQVLSIPGTTGSGDTGDNDNGGSSGDNPNPIEGTDFELGGQVITFSYPSLMSGAGMTWAKVQIRYNQGDDPSIAQGAIDAAHSQGFKVLLSVIGEPSQLAANTTQYYQDFANFLGGVAALGAEGIEVWNEMNIDREWPSGLISGVQYTQMLSAAYQAIKASNANTLVISGAPAPTGFFNGCTTAGCDDDKFIAQMAQAGAADYMDCVGIHYNAGITSPYASSGAPVDSSSHYSWYYPSMINVYANTFPGVPLCFTELGYLSGEGYSELPAGFSWAAGTSVAEQAEWLANAVTIAREGGVVKMIIVWNVDSTEYGADPMAGYAIVRPDQTCPACNTLAVAMQ